MAILYATVRGYLDKVAVTDVKEYERGLYEFLDSNSQACGVMQEIRDTGALSEDADKALAAVLTEYTDAFVKAR